MNSKPNAVAGYCCSGTKSFGNGDCPAEAIAAQTSEGHYCIVAMKKGKL